MARSVPEWIGKTDDTAVPDRVRLRVFERFGKCCDGCGVSLIGRRWTCDHKTALINARPGENLNRESNLRPLGDKCCNPAKNAADVAEKSATYHTKLKHYGVRRPSKGHSSFRTNKDSPFKQKIDGTLIERATGRVLREGRR